jgi:hypothetical protein
MRKTRFLACAFALSVFMSPVSTGAGPKCYPKSRFQPLSGGLVSDTLTGLVWQQQASSSTMTWSTASQTYCPSAGSGFRLPTVKELDSLLDLTVTSGAKIDQVAFPNTPAEFYWSSTKEPSGTDAWCVNFGDSTVKTSGASTPRRARCVR